MNVGRYEKTYIQSTSSVIEMSILERNNELDVPVDLGAIHCNYIICRLCIIADNSIFTHTFTLFVFPF